MCKSIARTNHPHSPLPTSEARQPPSPPRAPFHNSAPLGGGGGGLDPSPPKLANFLAGLRPIKNFLWHLFCSAPLKPQHHLGGGGGPPPPVPPRKGSPPLPQTPAPPPPSRRLITSCFAVPKHRELRARYRHELTSTAAEGLIAVLHVRDLVPQTLAVLELAYECYLVTTYQWPKAAAYGGNGTVKQRWAGEELMALRRLNAPLIGPVLLEKMVGCVGAAAAEEWGDLRHRLRAILEMARRDHSAFRESRDGPLERINGLIAQCERATPPASGGAEGPERGRGVGAAAGGRTGDVGEARRESPAAGASEAGAGGADGGRRERGGSEGEPPRKRAKGARGTPQPREAEQEKVAA